MLQRSWTSQGNGFHSSGCQTPVVDGLEGKNKMKRTFIYYYHYCFPLLLLTTLQQLLLCQQQGCPGAGMELSTLCIEPMVSCALESAAFWTPSRLLSLLPEVKANCALQGHRQKYFPEVWPVGLGMLGDDEQFGVRVFLYCNQLLTSGGDSPAQIHSSLCLKHD